MHTVLPFAPNAPHADADFERVPGVPRVSDMRDRGDRPATTRQSALCAWSRYDEAMIRTLDLDAWAGLWVAVGKDDRVKASAAELAALIAEVDRLDLDVEIMRAPVPGEPVVFGLG